MPIYSVDAKVCLTLYVKADNEQEARKRMLEYLGPAGDGAILDIAARDIYLDENREIFISPAMTCDGIDPDGMIEDHADFDI